MGKSKKTKDCIQNVQKVISSAESLSIDQLHLLDLIFEHTLDNIVLLDNDYNFVRVSRTYAEACQREPEEFIGKNHFELYPSSLKEEFDEVKRDKTIYRRTARPFIFPDHPEWGTTYWNLGLVPILDKNKDIEFFLFTLKDVTKQIKKDDELLESERKFRAIAEDMPNMICRFQADGTIDYVNDAYCNYFQKNREELIGSSFYLLIPEDERKRVRANIASLSSSKPVQSHEHQVILPNGDVAYQRWTNRAICGSNNNVKCYQAIGEDITEQKQMEHRLKHAERMQAFGHLAGGVAHDFNNIIAGIQGFTEIEVEDAEKRGDSRPNLDHILKATSRAAKLIQQILVFSTQTEDCMEPISIVHVTDEIVHLLKASLPSTVEINYSGSSKTLPIIGDSSRIHEVILNLATNASHAMKGKGILTIACDEETFAAPLCGQMGELAPGDYVTINVEDTGCGMAQEVITQIFEPFFTTKEIGQGVGMGLAVVFGIVQKHNGNIIIESEVGKGSLFKVYLPKATEEVIYDMHGEHVEEKGQENVLFVDDDPLVKEFSTQMLTRMGYCVTSCSCSYQAFDMVNSNPGYYDIVITDQTMPKMTGLELAEKIKMVAPKMPVILCSGNSSTLKKDAMKKSGINVLLKKPFTKAELSSSIRELLPN